MRASLHRCATDEGFLQMQESLRPSVFFLHFVRRAHITHVVVVVAGERATPVMRSCGGHGGTRS